MPSRGVAQEGMSAAFTESPGFRGLRGQSPLPSARSSFQRRSSSSMTHKFLIDANENNKPRNDRKSWILALCYFAKHRLSFFRASGASATWLTSFSGAMELLRQNTSQLSHIPEDSPPTGQANLTRESSPAPIDQPPRPNSKSPSHARHRRSPDLSRSPELNFPNPDGIQTNKKHNGLQGPLLERLR